MARHRVHGLDTVWAEVGGGEGGEEVSELDRPYHKAANLFPLMEGDEFANLKADITANGLHEPIWIDAAGAILDGRNRHSACIETNTPLKFRKWNGGGSAVAFVVSMNLHRRHLTSSQRAVIGLDVLPMLEKEAQERMLAGVAPSPTEIIPEGESREHVAHLFQTNPRYVSDAKKLESEAPGLLEAVRAGEKTIPQAKRELKERKREKKRQENRQLVESATEPLPFVEGQTFQAIVLDPPWDWDDEGDCDQLGRARPTYATMPLDEVASLPIPKLAGDNAHIYLWITNRSLPKGFALLERWGFRYITTLTWCKPHFGMGNYFRGSTEHVLFGVRGSLSLLRKDMGTWFAAPRPRRHSSKPPEFYELVESCSPGPWLEMFSRMNRPGWIVWGAEVA